MRLRPESRLAWLLAALPLSVLAQEEPSNRLRVSGTATLIVSDNLSAGSGDAKDAGVILTLAPGIGYQLRSGTTQADIDYSATLLHPIRVSTPVQRLQHALRSNVRSRHPDSGLGIDLRGDISQQSRSAFGGQRSATGLVLGNQVEVWQGAVEPSWTRRLGGLAELQLQHAVQQTNARRSSVGDSTQRRSSLELNDVNTGPLGWALQLQRTDTDARGGRDNFSELARLSLNWTPDPEWRLGVSGGHERSDQSLNQERSRGIYGASMRWLPGPRTTLAASMEQRVAGRTHGLNFQHRFVRSVISYADSRSINPPGIVGASGAQTNFDLLFAQLASVEPDPGRRADLVRNQLQQQGLDANAVASQGFISGRNTLSRTRSLGASYSMVRSTITLNLSRTESERLGAANEAQDDFAQTPLIASKGLSLSLSHRLTPLSGISLTGQWQRNEGITSTGAASTKSLALAWTTQFNLRLRGSLSLRHTSFESASRPSAETALLASLNHQF